MGPEDFRARKLSSVMRQLSDHDSGCDFHVIRAGESTTADKPLMIMIHPGDVVAEREGWETHEERAAAIAFWNQIGTGMRKELATAQRLGYDFCVLHRCSSTELSNPTRLMGLEARLWQSLNRSQRDGAVLYGDDLDAAADWMIDNLSIATRPKILMSGGFADPEHGCLTYIGQAFSRLIGEDIAAERLEVSPYSPPGAGPGIVWRPTGSVRMVVPDDLQRQMDEAQAIGDAPTLGR